MKGALARLGGDSAVGIAAASVGACAVLVAQRFPDLTGGRPGPALFPTIVGTLLIVLGVALVGSSLRGHRGGAAGDGVQSAPEATAPPGSQPRPTNASRWLNVILVFVAPMAFVLIAPMVGSLPTLAVIGCALMLRLGVRPLRAIVISGIAIAAIQVLFVNFMGVFLP